jgi:hypothetical protein
MTNLFAQQRIEQERYLIGNAKAGAFSEVVATLHEGYRSSVEFGDAPALLLEVDKFMQGDKEGRRKALLHSFLGATFGVEGRSDLQRSINFISNTHGELLQHGEDTSETIRNTILLQSLPSPLSDPFNISLWKQKLSHAQIVGGLTDYANNPPIALQLAAISSLHANGMNSGMSQSVFAVEANAGQPNAQGQAEAEQCRTYPRGACNRNPCRFSHDGKPGTPAKCVHCQKAHPSDKCWTTHEHLRPTRNRKPPGGDKKHTSLKAQEAMVITAPPR